jgi:hypothetical protein
MSKSTELACAHLLVRASCCITVWWRTSLGKSMLPRKCALL